MIPRSYLSTLRLGTKFDFQASERIRSRIFRDSSPLRCAEGRSAIDNSSVSDNKSRNFHNISRLRPDRLQTIRNSSIGSDGYLIVEGSQPIGGKLRV
jgi:hypothetical protein